MLFFSFGLLAHQQILAPSQEKLWLEPNRVKPTHGSIHPYISFYSVEYENHKKLEFIYWVWNRYRRRNLLMPLKSFSSVHSVTPKMCDTVIRRWNFFIKQKKNRHFRWPERYNCCPKPSLIMKPFSFIKLLLLPSSLSWLSIKNGGCKWGARTSTT